MTWAVSVRSQRGTKRSASWGQRSAMAYSLRRRSSTFLPGGARNHIPTSQMLHRPRRAQPATTNQPGGCNDRHRATIGPAEPAQPRPRGRRACEPTRRADRSRSLSGARTRRRAHPWRALPLAVYRSARSELSTRMRYTRSAVRAGRATSESTSSTTSTPRSPRCGRCSGNTSHTTSRRIVHRSSIARPSPSFATHALRRSTSRACTVQARSARRICIAPTIPPSCCSQPRGLTSHETIRGSR